MRLLGHVLLCFILLLLTLSMGYTADREIMMGMVSFNEEEVVDDSLQWTDYSDRMISFSGYSWRVKGRHDNERYEPGGNYYSNDSRDVYVDDKGFLHLSVVYRDGKWWSSEIVAEEVLGYGQYIFQLDSRVDKLDKNLVMDLHLYEYQASNEHKDRQNVHNAFYLQFSRWQDDINKPARYVCPPKRLENRHCFDFNLSNDAASTHSFRWASNRIECKSWYGLRKHPTESDMITYWSYSGSEVPRGKPRVHMAFWLNGDKPHDNESHEIVIRSFRFEPLRRDSKPMGH
ncbi:hypothetical protein KS4_02090 [Poriferisphaera corsica]|uniref:GH16 domain-containing protein n=1 Tax=Poriferisphaera corsica TaxID=2528020 RepID=A0A517YPN5_9BACT|nr:hypothetical protein [Poriferisphaera corsica]QDU32180.1 hypothetical protein KS4_02090 [Poriferisphaera corsica]